MLNQQTIDLIKDVAERLCALAPDDDREAEAYIDEVCAALGPMTKRRRAQQRTDLYYSAGNVNRIPIKPCVDEAGFTHRCMEVGGGGSGRGRMDEGRKECETE